MLEPALAAQLRTHLANITRPVTLAMSTDDSAKSAEMVALLNEVADLSDQVTVHRRDDDARRPSFAIERSGTDVSVRFAGVPMGHEFTSFVLALLQVGGHPSKATTATIETIQGLEGDHHFETFYSLSCQNCPDVVQALNLMSILNPRITHTAIDGAVFPAEAEERRVLAVPTVFRNGELFLTGRSGLDEIVAKLDSSAIQREAQRLDESEPYEVLVVGGGPAGATAAIYAARKGIRTGIVAMRFGGQLLDTMGIENYPSASYTEGPRLSADLARHVHEYDVDVMIPHEAEDLLPADPDTGLVGVRLDNGATLHGRSVILSTGARWRTTGVPGEEEYRNKGVTFCPHCDGPLFSGKRVAVIGGGNSGVEAAIDLAGIVGHVTLLEFDDQLRADDVLQRKLRSLPNVTIAVNALTSEIKGDGSAVTELVYQDRISGEACQIELEGVFVQIGLLPNTEWLEGRLELNGHGEIVVDGGGRTSLPGVFAAGDCTDTPFKQIVVAAGAGATASLSAFDHLIRTSAPTAPVVA